MRAHFTSCTISLAVHLVIVGAFLSVPLHSIVRQKSIALDFSIVNGHEGGKGNLSGGPEKKIPEDARRVENGHASAIEKKTAVAAKHDDASTGRPIAGEVARYAKKTTTGIDQAGQVSVAEERQAAGVPASGTLDTGAAGQGGKGVKTLNYAGPGGVDERNFSFIRDRIIQNIIYPERARRMGWEGRVTLSFTVNENGSIGDIKIINSSGFPVLDENARDAVAKTNFKRKVPVRLVVLLPVEYRLR
ncbi:MAG TPA: energy transducer TonB [Syntrophorhabdaceae bacterium]|nr:energy transducer TonB [Syntrophorhabdaceae bacterium]